MKMYRLVIPGLISSAMAAAITIHSMCVLPSSLIQLFLMRYLLANAVGLCAMLIVSLLARSIHLVVLLAILASAMAWLLLTTFHWPWAAYFPPIAAVWLASGCAAVAVENRRRAAWVVFGIWCLAISLYATRHIMLERERPSATCGISAGQTN